MRFQLASMLLLAGAIVLAGCVKRKSKGGSDSAAVGGESTTRVISFKLENSGFALDNTIDAWVKNVDLVCPDQTYSIVLTKENPKFEIARDISNCTFKLKAFIADKLADLPMDTAQFVLGQDGIVLNDGPVVGSYEYKNQNGEILDRRLVNGTVTMSTDGCPGLVTSCDFRNINVMFSYSELTRTDIKLLNKLSIHSVTLGMEVEPAPDCTATAEYLQPPVSQALDLSQIKLKISLTNCQKLFNNKIVEFASLHHRYNKAYQIRQGSGDGPHVVGLHEKIDAANKNFTYNGNTVEIFLTLAEIKELTGMTSTFAALREDFVLAIRNKGGKSIHYYVIDNECTTDLADMVQDKIAALSNQSWTLNNPHTTAYWKITSWLTEGDSTKSYDGFCMDTDRQALGHYSGRVVSSTDLDLIYRLGLVEQPANMPLVNYIINKYYNKSPYTWSDVQRAIWLLIENDANGSGLGSYNQTRVNQIIADAVANGANYSPACSNDALFAILLIPQNSSGINAQITIAIVKPSDVGVEFCPAP